MPAKQLRDVVETVRRFNQQLVGFLEEQADGKRDERTRELMDFMARHGEHLNAVLAKYDDDKTTRILDTWLHILPDEAVRDVFGELRFSDDMTTNEVIDQCLRFDRALCRLYQEFADSAVLPQVAEVFSNLLEMEEGKHRRFSQALLEYFEE